MKVSYSSYSFLLAQSEPDLHDAVTVSRSLVCGRKGPSVWRNGHSRTLTTKRLKRVCSVCVPGHKTRPVGSYDARESLPKSKTANLGSSHQTKNNAGAKHSSLRAGMMTNKLDL